MCVCVCVRVSVCVRMSKICTTTAHSCPQRNKKATAVFKSRKINTLIVHLLLKALISKPQARAAAAV